MFSSSGLQEFCANLPATMRVLIVEDEKKLADSVALGLRSERYAVDVAYDGVAGHNLAFAHPYDLMILDLMLPGLSGEEIVHSVRQSKPNVPILILTARDRTEDKVKQFEAGADDYLTKPFAFAELLVRVKSLLRRGSVPRANVLRVADLELDRLSLKVRRAGKRIELTPKEYALLEYLMANSGRVLSRTMIIEHVWDESFEGLTNIVDVFIRHLRAKIDGPFEQKLLETIRGAGYSISDEP
jgi:two-component system copper resistance phosphate regulon response regulator CusR